MECISNAFRARGHECFTVDWNEEYPSSLHIDIGTLEAGEILEKFGRPDVIWMAPDCTSYSVAAISKHRRKNKETGNLDPITDYAKKCDEVNQHCLKLVEELQPKCFFIENPRGGMRSMSWMKDIPRYTVTFCQYGDFRMKPTDLWTNHPNPQFKPPCKNGDPCHESAPRGSRSGTQRIIGAAARAMYPKALCEHIVDICEEYINGN